MDKYNVQSDGRNTPATQQREEGSRYQCGRKRATASGHNSQEGEHVRQRAPGSVSAARHLRRNRERALAVGSRAQQRCEVVGGQLARVLTVKREHIVSFPHLVREGGRFPNLCHDRSVCRINKNHAERTGLAAHLGQGMEEKRNKSLGSTQVGWVGSEEVMNNPSD